MNEPARVTRRLAMDLLAIRHAETFRKVVDANPDMVHRLPGETRAHYRTDVIARLLASPARCAASREGAKNR